MEPGEQIPLSSSARKPAGSPRAWRGNQASRWRQFCAVLRKNYLLQTRSRRLCWGAAGWAGLLVEVSVPVLFFLLMWLPKYFFNAQTVPLRVYDQCPLESTCWAGTPPYGGAGPGLGQAPLRILGTCTPTAATLPPPAQAPHPPAAWLRCCLRPTRAPPRP